MVGRKQLSSANLSITELQITVTYANKSTVEQHSVNVWQISFLFVVVKEHLHMILPEFSRCPNTKHQNTTAPMLIHGGLGIMTWQFGTTKPTWVKIFDPYFIVN